jgi:hypothetical protein
MLNFLSSMRSVSIALLQAIDQRLCALISRTNSCFLGELLDGRNRVIEKFNFVFEIAGKGVNDKIMLVERFGELNDGGCVVFCFSSGASILTVKGGKKDCPVIQCTSLSSVMQLFSMECNKSKVNLVEVSPGVKTITLNGQSIAF